MFKTGDLVGGASVYWVLQIRPVSYHLVPRACKVSYGCHGKTNGKKTAHYGRAGGCTGGTCATPLRTMWTNRSKSNPG